MKAKNSSWKDIAQQVGASKKDVQNRYKELNPTNDNESKESGNKDNKCDQKGNEKKGKKDKSDKQATVESEDEQPLLPGAFFGDDLTEAGATTTAADTTPAPDDTGNAFDEPFFDDFDNLFANTADDTAKDKDNKGGKKERKNKKKEKSTSIWEDGFGDTGVTTVTFTDTEADKGANNHDGNANQGSGSKKSKKSKKGGNDNDNRGGDHQNGFSPNGNDNPINYSDYNTGPYAKRLIPDQNWSADDCQALEMLVGRYDTNRWLYIQASFYNWTGRMVPGEIIRAKFEQDGLL